MQPVFQLFQHAPTGGDGLALGTLFYRAFHIAVHRRRAGENNARNVMRQGAVDNLLHGLMIKLLARPAAACGQCYHQRIHIHQAVEIVRIAHQLRFQA
ncbi:hypothetical protein D3C81_2020560 [compost metagenome]